MEKSNHAHAEKMPINPYPESEIRAKILNKIDPVLKKGNSKHTRGDIYIDGKWVAKVKIPNHHPKKMMYKSKSKFIAQDLKLSGDEFNDLIDCPLKGPAYYEILRKKVS